MQRVAEISVGACVGMLVGLVCEVVVAVWLTVPMRRDEP